VPGQPAAFMSYVRFNDQHDDGQLTQFRERLSAEVRVQTGEEFLIFQDRNDIAWGQNWQQRLDEALDAVTLLLVIITPSFFRSPACRAEVERFLARERELGREDLILPVYYVSAPELDDPIRRDADELAQVLASRQYADWRELRFEPFTSPTVRKAVARLATRIRDTAWHPSAGPSSRLSEPMLEGTPQSHSTEPISSVSLTAKTEPPTHVVDFYERGDFATVGAAVAAAQPGDRIRVRPGLYHEELVIDKPLEILGDGPVNDIVIEADGTYALLFRASIGRVANLTLRQAGDTGKWGCVEIAQGRLELDGCDISSLTSTCVAIRNAAYPRLSRNTIHDGKRFGILVADEGLGTLEDNDIFANALGGVIIRDGSNPTLRRNTIHDGKEGGVLVAAGGLGTLEDNDIFANAPTCVAIRNAAYPRLSRNTIHDGKRFGILVADEGLGTLEDNDIFANNSVGVEIRRGGSPTLHRNRVSRHALWAIRVYNNAGGVFEGNDLSDNNWEPWNISQDSKANITRVRNRRTRKT
jgi:parallel beta-helix repeat protein